MTNKEVVRIFFDSLWTDPERARSLCTEDVTWITTRSMPIPGREGSTRHVGWDAVKRVADSGKDLEQHRHGSFQHVFGFQDIS